MERLKLQLSHLIDDTYISHFLNQSKSFHLNAYRSQVIQVFPIQPHIKKYYSINEAIKTLSLIRLHLNTSFNLKASPILSDHYIATIIKQYRRTNSIRIRLKLKKECKVLNKKNCVLNIKKINKNNGNNGYKSNIKHTRNKSCYYPIISKPSSMIRDNKNQCNQKLYGNTNANAKDKAHLQHNLSASLSSLPVYHDYSKIFSAFVYGKYRQLINNQYNNENLKENDKLAIFQKYLIETRNALSKRGKLNKSPLKLTKVSNANKILITSRSNITNRKAETNGNSNSKSKCDTSARNKGNGLNRGIRDHTYDHNQPKINEDYSSDIVNVNDDVNENDYVNDEIEVKYINKCVGDDTIIKNLNNHSYDFDNYNYNDVDNSTHPINQANAECPIKLYDVIFKYKSKFSALPTFKKVPSPVSYQLIRKDAFMKYTHALHKNNNDHIPIYHKGRDGRIYLPKIKIIGKSDSNSHNSHNNSITNSNTNTNTKSNIVNKQREAYFISKLENVLIKKCVLNQINIE